MEDTFRVRVDRAFGSLSSSSSSSSQSLTSSLWCLTDDEIQKKSWTREPLSLSEAPESNHTDPFPSGVDRLMSAIKGNPNPNFRVCREEEEEEEELEKDLDELDDDCGEGTSSGLSEIVGHQDEESDIRASIGLDSTLDFEEEEDQYDKVAVGREKAGDRLYMSDVTDYIPDFYSNGEIPTSFKEVSRDPRANHLAAKLRLEEDAEAARSFNSLQVSEPTEPPVSDTQNNTSENGNNLKSILKRKEDQMGSKSEKQDQMGSKSEKRVRFEPSCKNFDEKHSSDGEITLHEGKSSERQDFSSVPDYLRNPSRYTHYTFDSDTDMNDASNRQAYMDFLNMTKKLKDSEPEVPADLSKPVIFNPKKKVSQMLKSSTSNDTNSIKDSTMEESLSSSRKNLPIAVSFASENMQEDEASEMDVDEQASRVIKVGGGQRTVRRYRPKPGLESNDSDS